MDCIECKVPNPETNRFCGQCGAELGRSLNETVRRKGFRDRQATEMEIAESVASRLMKWASWLGSIAALIVVLFGLLLGKSCQDVRTVADIGKAEIQTAVREGTKEIGLARQATTGLTEQIAQLQSDIDGYKQVNSSIAKLQKQFNSVQGQIVDLGVRSLRAKSFEATGPEPGAISFGKIGCPPSALSKGGVVAFCAEGSPLSLFQLTSAGELTPVAGRSPVGFQDASMASKSTCTVAKRGTFYVEKGSRGVADKPFLCAKKSDNTYDWIQLGMIP